MSLKDIYESRLANTCQALAQCMSFSDESSGRPDVKRILLDASHCLDRHAVTAHKKKDGYLLINARGKCRFMTWRERLARHLLRGKFEIRP
jgi:hypothetical protein